MQISFNSSTTVTKYTNLPLPLSVHFSITSSGTSSSETRTLNATALPIESNQLTTVASTFTSAFEPSG